MPGYRPVGVDPNYLPPAPVVAAIKNAVNISNLALAPDGTPYISEGANDVTVYTGPDGNYYFTPNA